MQSLAIQGGANNLQDHAGVPGAELLQHALGWLLAGRHLDGEAGASATVAGAHGRALCKPCGLRRDSLGDRVCQEDR